MRSLPHPLSRYTQRPEPQRWIFTSLLAVFAWIGWKPTDAGGQTLRGSRSSVDRMYARAVSRDLDFFRTSNGLVNAIRSGEVMLINVTEDVTIEDVRYPFVLPATLRFVTDIAARYRAACGERLVVTSATRPRVEQPRNASPKSVHPTGMAVDFRRPTGNCLTWLRAELLRQERSGAIEATEERRPPHFNVAVFSRAAPAQTFAADRTNTEAPPAPTTPRVGPAAASGVSAVATAAAATVPKPAPAKPAVAKPAPATAKAAASTRAPATYVVRSGDTLSEIAQRFGVTTRRLQSLNGLRGTRIRAGQRLKLR